MDFTLSSTQICMTNRALIDPSASTFATVKIVDYGAHNPIDVYMYIYTY